MSLVQFQRWYNPANRAELSSSLAYCLVVTPGLPTYVWIEARNGTFYGTEKQAHGRADYVPQSILYTKASPHEPIRLAVSRCLLPLPGKPASRLGLLRTIFHEYCNQSSRICEIRMSCHSRMKDDARQRRWYQPTGSPKELPALNGLSYHPPSLFITPAPYQRLRPGRFAFILTEPMSFVSSSPSRYENRYR